MGFKDAKRAFLRALEEDDVIHDQRSIEEKNWIANNKLTLARAREILVCARGDQASCSPHHFLVGTDVWIFKPVHDGQQWYVKGYLLEGVLHVLELHLVSFHPSER